MYKSSFKYIPYLLFCSLSIPSFATTEYQGKEHYVTASDSVELAVTRYPASGEHLILSIAPGYGIHNRSIELAKQLSSMNIEVWQIDLAEALFLPRSTELMRSFTGKYIADLIETAHQQTSKNIFLSARSYGAIPLLRGARLWQARRKQQNYLKGLILFSPDLYLTVPSLGLKPEYVPITAASNLPIKIFQDGIRGNRSFLSRLVDTLKLGGSNVTVEILPGVSSLFYKEDTTPATLQALKEIPLKIKESIDVLSSQASPNQPAKLAKPFKSVGSGINIKLKPFKGNFKPFPISLQDASGSLFKKSNYRDQVTVINFWATWCPPCVKEIPSLNRLREKMKDIPFNLVSINYAESSKTIKEFLKRIEVKFPVLLDHSGKESRRWNIVAFPSTFIIGADGKIHYGVNAAIHWDSPEIVTTLKALYQKTRKK